uniref:TLC domain-containing protein n=1 Tax=Cyanistes caeruleus TaxID=156563 RepID=A0A8C0UYI9_CYACU
VTPGDTPGPAGTFTHPWGHPGDTWRSRGTPHWGHPRKWEPQSQVSEVTWDTWGSPGTAGDTKLVSPRFLCHLGPLNLVPNITWDTLVPEFGSSAHLGTPGTHLSTPGAHLGHTWGHLDTPGTQLGTPGAHLGTPGAHLGHTWTHLGTPGTHLGTPGAHLGTPGNTRAHLGHTCAHLSHRHWLAAAYPPFAVPYFVYDVYAMYLCHLQRAQVKGHGDAPLAPRAAAAAFLRQELLMVLHHAAMVLVCFPVATLWRQGKGDFFLGCLLMAELSTPFVCLGKVLILVRCPQVSSGVPKYPKSPKEPQNKTKTNRKNPIKMEKTPPKIHEKSPQTLKLPKYPKIFPEIPQSIPKYSPKSPKISQNIPRNPPKYSLKSQKTPEIHRG